VSIFQLQLVFGVMHEQSVSRRQTNVRTRTARPKIRWRARSTAIHRHEE
jgi:hypothetical protein